MYSISHKDGDAKPGNNSGGGSSHGEIETVGFTDKIFKTTTSIVHVFKDSEEGTDTKFLLFVCYSAS